MRLSTLTCAHFARHLDSAFTVSSNDVTPRPLTLIEATPGRDGGQDRTPFSLVFHSASAEVLPQSTYLFDHPEMGQIDIFLVPLREAPGGIDYVATFN